MTRSNMPLILVAGAAAVAAVAGLAMSGGGGRSELPVLAQTTAPVPKIGDMPSTSPPKMDASPTTPSGTVSQGPAETGPHGQVDITKPMPGVPATSPRVAPDQNVQPPGQPPAQPK